MPKRDAVEEPATDEPTVDQLAVDKADEAGEPSVVASRRDRARAAIVAQRPAED